MWSLQKEAGIMACGNQFMHVHQNNSIAWTVWILTLLSGFVYCTEH